MACVIQRRGSTGTLHSMAHTTPKSCFGRPCQKSEASRGILFCCCARHAHFFLQLHLSMPLSLKSKVNLSNHNSQLDLRNTLIRDRHAIRLCVSSAKKLFPPSLQTWWTFYRSQNSLRSDAEFMLHQTKIKTDTLQSSDLWLDASADLTLVVTRIKEKRTKESWRPVQNKAEALCAKGSTSCTSTAAAATIRKESCHQQGF